MAAPYRRNDRGGSSYTPPARGISTRVPTIRIAGFGWAAVKLFLGSQVLAFGTGIVIGIYQSMWGNRGDTTEIADFALQSVTRVLHATAEWAINTFALSKYVADRLLDSINYIAIPYQELAYAGGYSGSTIVQFICFFIPSWSFHL